MTVHMGCRLTLSKLNCKICLQIWKNGRKKTWMTICTKNVLKRRAKIEQLHRQAIYLIDFRNSNMQDVCLERQLQKKCPYRKLGRICLKQKFAQKIHSNNKSCLKWHFAILQMLKGINCQSQSVDSRFSLKLGAYLVQKSLTLRTSKKRIRLCSRYQSMKRWNFQQFICIHS